MIKQKEIIFALATPKGKSALAVFRVSGKNSHKVIRKISSNKKITPKKTNLTYFCNTKMKPIDKTLTTYFKSPKTYTGEDMVEVSCHGSVAIINKITTTLLDSGIRPAEPGEFTKRALENDKLDITQVEGLSDLIDAETEKQRQVAFQNLEGHVSDYSKKLNNKMMKMLADTEALIDFVDEDLPKNIIRKIQEQNRNIIKEIEKTLSLSKISKPIKNGFLITVLGKPNTGKSSFINYISGRDVSIVTNIPGTTTDSIESQLEIDGYKFRFVDTAGIRKHKNTIEKIGIEKAYKSAIISDLNLVFLEDLETDLYEKIPNKIFIQSKQDIHKSKNNLKKTSKISSITGYGIKKLINRIKKSILGADLEKIPLFSRERHIKNMEKCLKTLKSINFKKSVDMTAYDIRSAIRENQEIYQKFDIEKILDIIFSDFCIGK